MAQKARPSPKVPKTSRERVISKYVEDIGIGDGVEEIYGPMQMADSAVWEVWVKDEYDTWATRYVEEMPGENLRFYDTFQQLMVRLNIQHREIVERAQTTEWEKSKEIAANQQVAVLQQAKIVSERFEQMVMLLSAAAGFAVCIALAAYLILSGDMVMKFGAFSIIACVLASGTYFFYKRFIVYKLPVLPDQKNSPPQGGQPTAQT